MNGDESSGRSIVQFADRLLRPFENIAAIIAAVMMFMAMVFTTFDAVLRYTINKPLAFNYFFTENYLLVGLVCMPMAWGFRTGGYIRISFLLGLIPRAVGNLLMRVGLLVSAVFTADMAWLGGKNWHDAWVTNRVEIDVVNWPWHWSWIWVPIGLGLLTLRLIVIAFGPAAELNIAHAAEEDAV